MEEARSAAAQASFTNALLGADSIAMVAIITVCDCSEPGL
jgi:hypothetical protein